MNDWNQFCFQKLSILEKQSASYGKEGGGGIYFVEQLPKIINTKKVCFQWLGETFFSKLRIFSID